MSALGNSAGVLTWALLSALGISALVAASEGSSVLPAALGMAALVVAFDMVWFSLLALLVDRTRRALVGSALARRVERLVGAVLIGLGVRVALEQR